MFVHYIHFILTSGHEKILTSEKCLFGHLGTSKGKGRQYLFRQALLVRKMRKQKTNQSTSGRIVAVSLIFGPLGFQTYVICFVPSQVLEIVICLCSCYSHLGPLS